MYYAMDEIGRDSLHLIHTQRTSDEKWHLINNLALKVGFSGIHLSKNRYEQDFGLSLSTLPDEIRRYRLTYHLDWQYSLVTDDECNQAWHALENALSFARSVNAEDVSIHPPMIPNGMQPIRGYLRGRFFELLSAIMKAYYWSGITLSIHSDIFGQSVLFQGMADYSDFIVELKQVCALIDLSAVFCQGYNENDLLEALEKLPVSGFYVSDAFPGREAGMHLPLGEGLMGLERILARYAKHDSVYGALSIDASFDEIQASLQKIMAFRHGGPHK